MTGEMVTKTRMKSDYGLTDTLIKHIGEPDEIRPNPHYKKGAPMLLYRRARVEQWIADNLPLLEQAQRRKAIAIKAVETKRQDAQAMVDEALQDLVLQPVPDYSTLYAEVCDYVSARYEGSCSMPGTNGIVSYIRHNYTNYHQLLLLIRGKVGSDELYQQIKQAINEHIAKHYGYKVEG